MTPGARIQATIEILDELLGGDRPVDRFLTGWFRRRRYAGSKDRRGIRDQVFFVLRHYHQLHWWCGDAKSSRALVFAASVFAGNNSSSAIAEFCSGGRYCPDPLSEAEVASLAALDGKSVTSGDQPDAVRHNLELWLFAKAQASLGSSVHEELAVLSEKAPVDLRVNTLKAGREVATIALGKAEIDVAPTELSPLGLRMKEQRSLDTASAYRDGWVEIQDEGSQLVALLCDVHPGMRVLDLCAGAGGKSLALAAFMQNQGDLNLCDIDADRLKPAGARLRRAGVTIAKLRPLKAKNDPWLAGQAGGFDRVLVDAPCTGSGAWRRNPVARLQLTEERLDALCATQRHLLTQAASLVKPGGKLIYATCSILADENDAVVEDFLAKVQGFDVCPIADVWRDLIGGECPSEGRFLHLTPYKNGTDGFFVAVFERKT
jgi:16S rRNA (cytosine967-C5)-methyltransferase